MVRKGMNIKNIKQSNYFTRNVESGIRSSEQLESENRLSIFSFHQTSNIRVTGNSKLAVCLFCWSWISVEFFVKWFDTLIFYKLIQPRPCRQKTWHQFFYMRLQFRVFVIMLYLDRLIRHIEIHYLLQSSWISKRDVLELNVSPELVIWYSFSTFQSHRWLQIYILKILKNTYMGRFWEWMA